MEEYPAGVREEAIETERPQACQELAVLVEWSGGLVAEDEGSRGCEESE
jgi:hypothetical protein